MGILVGHAWAFLLAAGGQKVLAVDNHPDDVWTIGQEPPCLFSPQAQRSRTTRTSYDYLLLERLRPVISTSFESCLHDASFVLKIRLLEHLQ